MVCHLYNFQEYGTQKIELIAKFKLSVAIWGEWRQDWTPLV
jgi:hypothetical protein